MRRGGCAGEPQGAVRRRRHVPPSHCAFGVAASPASRTRSTDAGIDGACRSTSGARSATLFGKYARNRVDPRAAGRVRLADATLVAPCVQSIRPVAGRACQIRAGAGPACATSGSPCSGRCFLTAHLSGRVPTHSARRSLLGGLDLVATLAGGRPVSEKGLLALGRRWHPGHRCRRGTRYVAWWRRRELATASESGEVLVAARWRPPRVRRRASCSPPSTKVLRR